jgi:hypothetical protein
MCELYWKRIFPHIKFNSFYSHSFFVTVVSYSKRSNLQQQLLLTCYDTRGFIYLNTSNSIGEYSAGLSMIALRHGLTSFYTHAVSHALRMHMCFMLFFISSKLCQNSKSNSRQNTPGLGRKKQCVCVKVDKKSHHFL